MTDESRKGATVSRRAVLGYGTGGLLTTSFGAPALLRSAYGRGNGRPSLAEGVQIGDVQGDSAVLWTRADRPARLEVRWSTRPDMEDARKLPWMHALDDRDYTAKQMFSGLPTDTRIHYQVDCLDLADMKTYGEPLQGSFLSAPQQRRDLRFVWSADTAGQGWGINPDIGGMRIYETMRQLEPDFFIHCGDMVYSDNPLEASVVLDDGRIWHNLLTPEKATVAETLDDFRGQFRYNLMDDNLRRFNAEVPMLAQWDDHEVTNNWYWELSKEKDARYTENSAGLMAARAIRAFHEYVPVKHHPLAPERLYERFAYGPLLEVFRIDLRSYRGPNSDAQPDEAEGLSPAFRIFGAEQLAWLKRALVESTATWKVIASSMPLGLVVYDDWETEKGAEAIALRDGPPAGRELELAELLTFIRDQGVANVLWLTGDVHYTAAHYYDPEKAQYRDFAPFWEFVSGPLNAGTFGPNRLDNTFGPQLVYQHVPPAGESNLSPLAGMQFFGQVDIDSETEVLTVQLKDLAGDTLFQQRIEPHAEPTV